VGVVSAQHHHQGVNAHRTTPVEDYMKRILCLIAVLLGVGAAALGSAPEAGAPTHDHLAMLKTMLAAGSSHGRVVPQPESVNPTAAKTFNIVARSFEFVITPATFAVNQGDVVTINLSVPSNDDASSHGLLMETYVENPIEVGRGKSKTITFTATTVGRFQFVCSVSTCGVGHSNMAGLFFVNPAAAQPPAVSSVTPNGGSTSGGTNVTISGTSFGSSATVKFGGTAATNVNVGNSTTITATTPAHAAGAVDVVVTNSDGQSSALAGGFTYSLPQPSIASITPDNGPTSGDTLLTIRGTNFQNGATVTIGGVPAANVSVVDPTTIVALTPLGPATEQVGIKLDVLVKNPDDTKATLASAFQYSVPALGITLVTPSAALPPGGTKVSITGTGFTSALASSITIGGVAATNVQVVDAITMIATVPPHAVGPVDVVVNVGGKSATAKGAFAYLSALPRHRSAKP
jgi:plastocyanin